MSEKKSKEEKDSRISNDSWRWLVMVCAVITTTARKAQYYSISIIIAQLHLIYQTSMIQLTLIAVLPLFIGNLSSFLPLIVTKKIKKHPNLILSVAGVTVEALGAFMSSLVDKPPWLILTYSTLVGIGFSFSSICGTKAVGEYFPRDSKHFILATSVVFMSSPLAKVIFNPLAYLIIAHFSWRVVFVFQGCYLLIGIVCSMSNCSKSESSNILSDTEEETIKLEDCEINENDLKSYQSIQSATTNDENKISLEKAQLKTSDTIKDEQSENTNYEKEGLWKMFADSDCKPEMALLFVCKALTMTSITGFYTILPHFLIRNSLSNNEASVVMTMYGVAELFAMMISAIISYQLKGRLIIVFIGTHLCMTTLFVAFIFASTYHQILACTTLFALNMGLFNAYTLSNATEVSGLPVEVSWAFESFSKAFGSILILVVTGLIYDIEKDFTLLFQTHAVIAFISCTGYTAISIIKILKEQKNKK